MILADAKKQRNNLCRTIDQESCNRIVTAVQLLDQHQLLSAHDQTIQQKRVSRADALLVNNHHPTLKQLVQLQTDIQSKREQRLKVVDEHVQDSMYQYHSEQSYER